MRFKKVISACFSISYRPVSSLLHFVLFFILGIFYGCGDAVNSGDLRELPLATLDSVSINEIDLKPESRHIVLSTNNGVFILEDDRLFSGGMQGETVTNLVVMDDQTMLLSIPGNGAKGVTTLFRTTNGGRSWNGFMRNWGGEEQISAVNSLTVDANNPDRLFGQGRTNEVRSLDGGRSWESVTCCWNAIGGSAEFIKIDPNDSNIIWSGGSDAIRPSMIKSEEGGDKDSWVGFQENLQIFEDENIRFDTNVTSLVIKEGNSKKLLISLCCFFSDIFRSEDGGETWEQSFLENREDFLTLGFTYALRVLAASPNSPNTVYASGQNRQGTLFYAVTRDFGETWETIEVPDVPGDISVNDLAVVERNGGEVLLFGTNKGFFRVPANEN